MPPRPLLPPTTHPLPRLVLYAQTFHTSDGAEISLLPLITQNTGVTHVIVAAIHLNEGPGNLTLNDDPPHAGKFKTLWSEVKWLQGAGVRVLGMLGEAAKGSYERLGGGDGQFEAYYIPLRDMIRTYNLQGLDLDVEEPIPLHTVTRLIKRLRSDFGSDFLITMAPVATALLPDPQKLPVYQTHPPPQRFSSDGVAIRCPNPHHPTLPHLSGFSYPELELSEFGKEIAWYNTQFYCGWGDAGTTAWYDAIISAGWDPRRVVMGVVTNPGNGAGHVGIKGLRNVLGSLRGKYFRSDGRGDGFGGLMGWEWFNSGECDGDVNDLEEIRRAGQPEIGVADAGGDKITKLHPQSAWAAALGFILRSPNPPLPAQQPVPPVPPPATKPNNLELRPMTAEQIRQILTGAAAARSQWSEEKVGFLVELGFGRQEAVAALDAVNGDVDAAAGVLLGD